MARSLACALAAVFTAGCATASLAAAPPPNLREAIRPELFPGLGDISAEELYLEGLGARFPGAVRHAPPDRAPTSNREAASSFERLPRGISYLRVYRLADAAPELRKRLRQSEIVIDLRFLRSTSAGSALAALLPRSAANTLTTAGSTPPEILPPRDHFGTVERPDDAPPVAVLCNEATAGPFEATLSALQNDGRIVGVGRATAGLTGFYEAPAITPGLHVLRGEIRAANRSLVGRGFQPRVPVDVDPDEDYAAYYRFESGGELSELVRRNPAARPADARDDGGESRETPPDLALSRAADVVSALQILGRMPDSSPESAR